MSFIIPVKRLYETKTLLAFIHPQPTYSFHVLIIPKKAVNSLLDLLPYDQFTQEFFSDMVKCVQSLVKKYELQKSGYRLIANGGQYQQVPQLHFHLISENEPNPSPTK